MPFATNGIYTPPTGAENATPGAVIRAATWITIFTDIAAALTQLGENSYINAPRYVSSGSFSVAATDSVIVVTGSSPTISLPVASTRIGGLYILGGAVSVFSGNNAVLVATNPDTISGQASVTLNRDFQLVYLQPASLGYVLGAYPNPFTQTNPVTTKTGSYTMTSADSAIIFNVGSSATLTMQSASVYPGRWLYVKTIQSQSVLANAVIVQPLVGPAGTLTNTIVAATAGKFAQLQSDGTNWVIMAGN